MSKTSTTSKHKYNDRVYKRYEVYIRRDSNLFAAVESCRADGHSFGAIVRAALELYFEEGHKNV